MNIAEVNVVLIPAQARLRQSSRYALDRLNSTTSRCKMMVGAAQALCITGMHAMSGSDLK